MCGFVVKNCSNWKPEETAVSFTLNPGMASMCFVYEDVAVTSLAHINTDDQKTYPWKVSFTHLRAVKQLVLMTLNPLNSTLFFS